MNLITSRIDWNLFLKIVKIAVGCCLAIFIAEIFGLFFATSAGIITYLTIQNTKKETLRLTLHRFLSFLYTAGLSLLFFPLIGTHWQSLCIVLLLTVGITCFLRWDYTLSVNMVICTHFFNMKELTLSLILNEFLLLAIGSLLAVLFNLYIPRRSKRLNRDIRQIESDLKNILLQLSDCLIHSTVSPKILEHLDQLEEMLRTATVHAFEEAGNTFTEASGYYLEYMDMRIGQCGVLRSFYHSIDKLTLVHEQSLIISEFMSHIGESLHEKNRAILLRKEWHEIMLSMEPKKLPENSSEFHNQAILQHILMELLEFIEIECHFLEGLSQAKMKKYWDET